MFGRRRSRSASVPDSHRISPENINLLAVAGDLSTFTAMIANRRTANSSAIAATSHDSDNPTKNSHPNPTFQMVATQSSDFNPAFRTSSAETCFTRPPLGGAAVASSVSHDSPPPARSKRKRPERRDSHRKKTSASALEDVAKVATPDSPSRSREQIMSGGTSPLFTAHKFPPPYREKEQPSENRAPVINYGSVRSNYAEVLAQIQSRNEANLQMLTPEEQAEAEAYPQNVSAGLERYERSSKFMRFLRYIGSCCRCFRCRSCR